MINFILRSMLFYRRSHLVVMMAVAVSTAVIGGSLIVGDSVRASLRQMTLSRLGGISHVLHSPRFVREQLAEELSKSSVPLVKTSHTAPGLLFPGSVEKKTADGQLRRAASVSILGLRESDWAMFDSRDVAAPKDSGIVLGFRTAIELSAVVGDSVSVWVELPSSIPRDSLLGERENISLEMVLTVEGVLPESAGASRFSLQPAQQLPYNAFVSLSTFQQRLNLEALEASRRNPVARPARINTILVGSDQRSAGSDIRSDTALAALMKTDADHAASLQIALQRTLTMADLGLRVRPIEAGGFLSVESVSMILEDAVSDAVLQAAENMGMSGAPSLVYLMNEISAADRTDQKTRYSMYSIVAGVDFQQGPPLGPFRLSDDQPVPELNDDEIILSAWLAEDLQVKVGDPVQTRWHEVGSHGDLPETHHDFVVKGILKPVDPVSINRDLTPFVEGVTDVDSFSDLKQPFEMEMNRIESEREQYSAQCERILKHAQDQAVATAESQIRNAEDQARVQQEEIQNKFKDNSQSAKQHLEEAIWMADSVLETGESAPRVEFEEARTRIAQMQITLNESFEAACFQLKRYRQSQPAPQTIDGNLAPKSCEGILSMQAAVAMDSLARFRKLKLAGLFRGPILLVPSIMVTGTLTCVAAIAGIRGAALLAAVGAGLLLSVVGIMVLLLLARKQVRHAWIPISKARQVGLLAGEIAMQAAVEHRRATTAAALATCDHEVKLAKAKWAPILDDLLAKSRVILEEVKQARNSKKVEIENQKTKLLQRALEVGADRPRGGGGDAHHRQRAGVVKLRGVGQNRAGDGRANANCRIGVVQSATADQTTAAEGQSVGIGDTIRSGAADHALEIQHRPKSVGRQHGVRVVQGRGQHSVPEDGAGVGDGAGIDGSAHQREGAGVGQHPGPAATHFQYSARGIGNDAAEIVNATQDHQGAT
ncbi:MAG: hypothetical protein WCO86_08915, partial [Planctomycetota bacterium]